MSQSAIARLSSSLTDHYRIDRELGAGGMATVYLAHDIKHDRDVAIKVLHPDLGAALGGERFLSEIRTTARLQHPRHLAAARQWCGGWIVVLRHAIGDRRDIARAIGT